MRLCWQPVLRLAAILLVASDAATAQVRVINEGFPGANTAQLEARLEDALSTYQPAYVIVFAGGNDALNDKALLPVAKTAAHLDCMVKAVESHGAKAILVQVHVPDVVRLMTRHKPEAYGAVQPLQRLALVNREIVRIARKDHAAVVPFDSVLRRAGGANADLSTDGVHLTQKGYALLANAVRVKLPKHLPTDATVLCFGDSLTYGIGVRSSGAPETAETYPAQLRVLLK